MLIPNNSKSPAKQRLGTFVDAANQQYLNAIDVEAVPIAIYNKTRSKGSECSCYKDHSLGKLKEQPPQTDANKTRSSRTVTLRKFSHNGQPVAVDQPLPSNVDPLAALDIPPAPVPDELAAGLVAFNNDGIYGGSTTKCCICFGTGHVGGYTYKSGLRLVMDVQSATLTGNGLDDTVRPFCTYDNTTATWSFRRPQYYSSVDIRVYNNDKLLPVKPVFTENGVVVDLLNPLHPPSVASTVCTVTSQTPFTHCVLRFDFAPRDMASMGAVNYNKDVLNENVGGEVEIVLPPSIYVYPEDVIVDNLNRGWEVQGTDELLTALNVCINRVATCRILQPWATQVVLKDMPLSWQ